MRHAGTLIIGAGQAGLALSRELTAIGRDHVVLERGRVGERWRSERWDSLALLTPNWLNRLPGSAPHADRDGFLRRDEFVAHLERYARSFGAPVVEGTTVLGVRPGYGVRTDAGDWRAENVVIASGAFDVPHVPAVARDAPVEQLHVARYRNPEALAPGGVLVVGSGASGQQIAAELARAGRDVTLAAGRHVRMPRRYRGRDAFAWLDAIGRLWTPVDDLPPGAPRREAGLPLDGRDGGATVDLGVLHRLGVRLTGRVRGFDGPRALFADDLGATARDADSRMRRLLARIDAVAGDAPEEEIAPVALPAGPGALDLRADGITTILWATGYRRSYPWLHVPVLDRDGEIVQRHGVTPSTGLYTLGQHFQRHRFSHTIGGVGRDAAYIAQRIAERTRTRYRAPAPLAAAAA